MSGPKKDVHSLKLLLIGDSAVGKTAFIQRFVHDTFEQNPSTISLDIHTRCFDHNNKTYKLALWDTAGQERFRTVTQAYYRGAAGIILMFDVSRRETFDHLTYWLDEIRKAARLENQQIMLVANKVDLDRVVSTEEASQLAKKNGLLYTETSVKLTQGIEQGMDLLLNAILLNSEEEVEDELAPSSVSLDNRTQNPGFCC